MPGRGRGKYTPPSAVKAELLKAAEAEGYGQNVRRLAEDNRTELFPDICLHSSGDNRLLLLEQQQRQEEEARRMEQSGGKSIKHEEKKEKRKIAVHKRTAKTSYLISKGRELQQRMQNSVFYVRSTKDVPDIIRYSDATKPPPRRDASAVLSYCLGGRTCTEMGRYVPEELVSGQVLSSLVEASNIEHLTDLERSERLQRQRTGSVGGQGDVEDDDLGNASPVEEESDEDLDYRVNHYESEGDESIGGDEGEATF